MSRNLLLLALLAATHAAAGDLTFQAPSIGTSKVETCSYDVLELYDAQPPCSTHSPNCVHWYDELTLFAGLEGSKQPQDFGVNANFGAQTHVNWGGAVYRDWGLGMQLGTNLVVTDNAVQVYELVGEAKDRVQSYTTIGLFQRTDGGWAWGFAYDFLAEDSYDNFTLGQWRIRTSYDWGPCNQFGMTVNLRDGSDHGTFGASTPVELRAINQGTLYWRHWWQTGVQTTCWGGIAGGHGENNAVTGPAPRFGESFVMGADILAPLNNYLSLYGETNLIFPADTGTVDAFLGFQLHAGGNARSARRGQFSPLLPVASATTFSTDLLQ